MLNQNIAVPADSAEIQRPLIHRNSDALPPVLTKAQLAQVLSCTPRHIDNLSRRGVIPRVMLGRSIRYRRDSVMNALAKLEGSATL